MSASAEQLDVQGLELERLWSVTTLLDMALGAGRGLQDYIARETATAAVDKRATLDAMLKEGTRDEAIKFLMDARWASIDRARARGDEVHRAAEAIALGAEPITMRDEIKPYVEQLVRWLKTWRPKFVLAEAPVYNLTYRYAGTCDGIFEIDGRSYLFDYKTTPKDPADPKTRSRPPYSETALQIAAYVHAEEVGVLSEQRYTDKQERYYLYDETVEHAPMPKVDGALAIIVSPFDCFAVPVSIGEVPWATFRHALEIAKWQQSLYRQAFGPQLIARPES
jgi:hypothetical protein